METNRYTSKEKSMSQQQKPRPKAPVIHVSHVDWQPTEWSDDPEAATMTQYGYELVIAPERDDNGKIVRWVYEARATSEISETPEIVTAGNAASRGGAMRAAGNPVNKLIREQWQRDRKCEREAAAKAAKAAKAKAEKAKAQKVAA
jgi:hypothetical protein